MALTFKKYFPPYPSFISHSDGQSSCFESQDKDHTEAFWQSCVLSLVFLAHFFHKTDMAWASLTRSEIWALQFKGTHDQGKWEWVVTLEQSEDEITPGSTLCCPLNPESWGSVMSDLDGNVMDTLLAFEDWSMLHLPLYLKFHKKVLHRGMSHYTDICPDQAIYLVTTCSWRDGGCTIASHIM